MPTSSVNGPRSLGRTGSKYLSARAQVLANNQICWLCGELIDMTITDSHDPMYATVDHIITVKEIESDPSLPQELLWDPKNLKPAHLSCNARRARTGTIKVAEHPTSRNWRE